MKNIAIIPARSGSKRILKKNIKPFMGKPIMAYSIEAALESELFDEVMVSTDSEEFAEVALRYGAKVPFFRSEKTSNDFATTAEMLNEVLTQYKGIELQFDSACCIYPTAPFITTDNLKQAYSKMENQGFDSIFTAVAYSYPIQRGLKFTDNKISMVHPEFKNARSQDLETIYHDAGQFYFFKIQKFLQAGEVWGDNTGAIILSELQAQDLDTDMDWQMAELKYKLINNL